MQAPFEFLFNALKQGMGARDDASASIRVAVYIDGSATPFLIETVRDALVPQTTNGLVRVDRLGVHPNPPKADTDVIIVLTSGSPTLQAAVQELVINGVPVLIVAESSVEVPFVDRDTPLLGLVVATEREHLLTELALWILARTEKADAFAANFTFMRTIVTQEIIRSTTLANAATGVLLFIPGADYPVMTLAQTAMALRLAAVHGYRIQLERLYEVAGVALFGLVLRGTARTLVRHFPQAGFIIKGAIGGVGTYAVGIVLNTAYERGVDYATINEALRGVLKRLRGSAPAA